MKLLLILENYLPHIGGVEIMFKNIAEGLVKQGHSVNIITHRIKGTKTFQKINGVSVHRIDCFHSRYLFSFMSVPKAIELAKQSDLINTCMYTGTLPAKIASIISRKKLIITIPEILGKNWNHFPMNFISKKIHQILEFIILHLGYDKIIAISKATQKCIPMKSSVVYPGIDYNIWKPSPKIKHKGFIMGFYGRPGISKGLEYLIRAMPLIRQKIPNAELHAIVSNDKTYEDEYNRMMNLIFDLDISDCVIIYDPISYKKLPDWLMSVDCVVVPSLTEGFGYCVAETCALGIPIVASRVGSIPEVISGRYRLCTSKSPESIYKNVLSIYNGQSLYKSPKKFKDSDCVWAYSNIYMNMTNVPNVPNHT